MFVSGAIIANATAVGGGIVFNPMLQLVFGVSGYSALVLAVTVQCAGMTSGTYGWYKKGEFSHIARSHLFMMAITSAVSTVLFTILFLQCRKLFASELLGVMKAASALVSFYVFAILWKEVKEKESMGISGQAALPQGSDNELREAGALRVDRRIFPWIVLGALLNVHTAVGVGELVFSHLIKYYKAPTRTAVAVGVMMQAISVVTQTVFNVLFLREYLLLDLVCIGLFCTMIGGRTGSIYHDSQSDRALCEKSFGPNRTRDGLHFCGDARYVELLCLTPNPRPLAEDPYRFYRSHPHLTSPIKGEELLLASRQAWQSSAPLRGLPEAARSKGGVSPLIIQSSIGLLPGFSCAGCKFYLTSLFLK